MNVPVIEGFLHDVAVDSPLPVLIYNFPSVTSGTDISPHSVIRLATTTPNTVGCKLTCENVGNFQRITSTLSQRQRSFTAFGGKSDFFLLALVAGSHGIIVALANIAPKLYVTLLRFHEQGNSDGAQTLKAKLSDADRALGKVGIVGVRAVIERYFGYGNGRARKPLGSVKAEGLSEEALRPIAQVVGLEREL